ncbi:MAG TPA: universal stress protein [Chloroflexota bacterium]|nr:universal stress protein [Chloroflexota bacterium]
MRVLIAVGGDEGIAYFRRVAELAPLVQAEVLLVHVIDERRRDGLAIGRHRPGGTLPLPPQRSADIESAEQERAHQVLTGARQALVAAGIPEGTMRDVVRRGRPNEVIRDLAVELAAELIVVGARHNERPGPHSLGKTARFLVDHAPVAALLVRPIG